MSPFACVIIETVCSGRFTTLLAKDESGHLEKLLEHLVCVPWPLVTSREEHKCKLDPGSPLRSDLPAGVLTTEVDLLRLEGHLGDPSAVSSALSALRGHIRDKVAGVSVVNSSGCGKTKAVLDLLRVSLLWQCPCAPSPMHSLCFCHRRKCGASMPRATRPCSLSC